MSKRVFIISFALSSKIFQIERKKRKKGRGRGREGRRKKVEWVGTKQET